MRTPCRARTTPSSTSGTSVMQTGQPGPMMTLSDRGSVARSPNRAIACSWLPQTCMMETGERPMSATTRTSASESDLARPGSRNFSSATPPLSFAIGRSVRATRVNLAADVVSHQVILLRGVTEQLLVERQRRIDLFRRDAANRISDMIQDVVAGHNGLIDDIEMDLLPHTPEVNDRDRPIDRDDLTGHTEAHSPTPSAGVQSRRQSRLVPMRCHRRQAAPARADTR